MKYLKRNTLEGDYNYYDCDPYLVGEEYVDLWYENLGRWGCDVLRMFPCHSNKYGGDCFFITRKQSPAMGYIRDYSSEEEEIVSFEEGIARLCKNGLYPWTWTEEEGEEEEGMKYIRKSSLVGDCNNYDCPPFLVGERRIALWNENESSEMHMFPCYSIGNKGDCFLIKEYKGEGCYEKIISFENGVKLLCEKVNFYWIIDKEIEEKGEE